MLSRLAAGISLLMLNGLLLAQERAPAIDAEHYVITAEIDPASRSLRAEVRVRFAPAEEGVSVVYFELNNALNVSEISLEDGQPLSASRLQKEHAIRISLPEPLPEGKSATLTFRYDGTLGGSEESPIYGIRFAAIQNDISYLLYPARWFPISGYTTDRYTYEMKVTVPAGNRVIATGLEKSEPAEGGKTVYSFSTLRPAFPGSIAVVQGEPVRAASGGAAIDLYFRGAETELAAPYGEEAGKIFAYLTSLYGLPPLANIAIVETGQGAPLGYSTEGILFLSPNGIGRAVNPRLLANQLARQWWGGLVSVASRDHLWLTNGAARFSELLYIEHTSGSAAFEAEVRDTYVEALTVENPPLIQTGRLEDYSPEFWAMTGGKGAAILNMLRFVIGDDDFSKLLRQFPDKFAGRPVTTGDFRRTAEEITGTNLQYFFIQWIESTGAPEFRLQYTVFRREKNFGVVGKVSQDMDTFRMPVELRIETDGNPEEKRVEVAGTSSEFAVETFGRPRTVVLDPNHRVLRVDDSIRIAVAIRRGEQFAEVGQFADALKEYQKALDVNRNSSLAHYRVAEALFRQGTLQDAANQFREALNGDLEPKWIEVWSHINLGRIFDITGQRERARNEFNLAIRTKDNTQGAQEEAAKYIDKPYQRESRPDI